MVTVIGAPAERQLRKVAGSEHHPPYFVGKIHKNLSALSRLTIFVGDVVNRLILPYVAEMLAHGINYTYLLERSSKAADKLCGIIVCATRSAETGHRNTDYAGHIKFHLYERAMSHKQSERGVETATYAYNQFGATGGFQTTLKSGYLHCHNLGTTQVSAVLVLRHKRGSV